MLIFPSNENVWRLWVITSKTLYQVIQSDLLIPYLEVTIPFKGSRITIPKGHQQNCQVLLFSLLFCWTCPRDYPSRFSLHVMRIGPHFWCGHVFLDNNLLLRKMIQKKNRPCTNIYIYICICFTYIYMYNIYPYTYVIVLSFKRRCSKKKWGWNINLEERHEPEHYRGANVGDSLRGEVMKYENRAFEQWKILKPWLFRV